LLAPFLPNHRFHGPSARALTDLQAAHAGHLIAEAGQRFDYLSFPEMGHFMQAEDPELFARTLIDWTSVACE
jgi:pimeloyl-ACP methyl ester carboxylesterase